MASWPTLTQLKARLDVTSTDWDTTDMARLLNDGIAWVKRRVGDWDEETDQPDDSLAQAALERAFELAQTEQTSNPRSERLLYGHRRRFGLA